MTRGSKHQEERILVKKSNFCKKKKVMSFMQAHYRFVLLLDVYI